MWPTDSFHKIKAARVVAHEPFCGYCLKCWQVSPSHKCFSRKTHLAVIFSPLFDLLKCLSHVCKNCPEVFIFLPMACSFSTYFWFLLVQKRCEELCWKVYMYKLVCFECAVAFMKLLLTLLLISCQRTHWPCFACLEYVNKVIILCQWFLVRQFS